MEQTTLEQFRSYVAETVMKAPQIYVQIKTLGTKGFGGWQVWDTGDEKWLTGILRDSNGE